MSVAATVPGVYFSVQRPPAEPEPLRTDVAGFVGRTRRGPVGTAVRVDGWKAFMRQFGGLTADTNTPYAVSGYFENDGQIAHVIRLGSAPATASAQWDVANPATHTWDADSPQAGGFTAASYEIEASSPGEWANGTVITLQYRYLGDAGGQLDVIVQAPGESTDISPGSSRPK